MPTTVVPPTTWVIVAGVLVGMGVAWLTGEFQPVFRTIAPPLGVVLATLTIYVVGQLDDLRDVSPPAKMAGSDPRRLVDQAMITPACGLVGLDVAQAAHVLVLTNLLAQRVAVPTVDPQSVLSSVTRLRAALPEAAAIGDLASLEEKLTQIGETASARKASAALAKASARQSSVQSSSAFTQSASDCPGWAPASRSMARA